jgi:multidrug efflux pump subunit AcrA (membrane-fusion protein)
VPTSAYADGVVWTVDSEGRARKRAVTAGIVAPQTLEVASGLRAGETIIVSPPQDLAEGARVKPTQ